MLQPYEMARKSIKRNQVNFGPLPSMPLTDFSHILLHSLKTSKYFSTLPKFSGKLLVVQKPKQYINFILFL